MRSWWGSFLLVLILSSSLAAMIPWPERVGDYCNVTATGDIEVSENDLMTVRRASLLWVEQQERQLLGQRAASVSSRREYFRKSRCARSCKRSRPSLMSYTLSLKE